MKKTLIAIAILVMVLGVAGQSDATPLSIPGSVSPTSYETSPGVGAALASLSTRFFGEDSSHHVWFSGTLNQYVRQNANGFMVFEFEIISDDSSEVRIKLADITDWNGFSTNVGTFSGVLPSVISRETPGYALSYSYTYPAIDHNEWSGFWVETNTKYFKLNGTTQLQGTGNTRIQTYSPVATPEPGSAMLLGMGLLGFAGMLRRKFMA